MSLYRQLLVTALSLFLLLFTVMYSLHIHLLCNQLAEQQAASIHHHASAAGLALTPYLETDNSSALERVVHTLFEKGGYHSIALQVFANESHIRQELPMQPSKAPRWLVQLGWFENTSYRHTITSGWLQLAELTLVADAESLYQQLWYQMRYLAGVGIIGLLLLWGLLGIGLRLLLLPYLNRPLMSQRSG
ncbi:MAG: hypothetical protein GX324_09395 [Aeromonadales bacterium]|nr:hypothetical protein [Aeromonadales bacterium]